jgi:uncharacterized protein YndB with AHSA1/START domain
MSNIFHCFPVNASPDKVFEAISTPGGLDNWWTRRSEAEPKLEGNYVLDFGPPYIWNAVVTKYTESIVFELQFWDADPDWTGTKVGFSLVPKDGKSEVNFYHTGWPETNEHFRISSFCWAMYLRILKRYIEFGEKVPYENRLNV